MSDAVKDIHKEAFALMIYQCKDCHKVEMLWNSRDGVTPFGIFCKYCGGSESFHAVWYADVRMPDLNPPRGSLRFFFDHPDQARYPGAPEIDDNGVECAPKKPFGSRKLRHG